MNIAVVHNHYQQPGGEDQVFSAEATLLEERGHVVTRYTAHNDAVTDMSRLALASSTVWNAEQYSKLRSLFDRVRPHVVHVHNTLPIVSPAVYYAARAAGAAVVQTLHNYRLVCPSGLLFRDGAPCESCVGKTLPWPSVVHACYRGSRAATGAVAASLVFHRAKGTYRHVVDRYIALTEFAKSRFVAGGLPEHLIVVKPNFLAPDPGPGDGAGGYALFVGRLSVEKGLDVLLDAWRRAPGRMPLRIIGDGPLATEVTRRSADIESVKLLGRLPAAAVRQQMKSAAAVVVPSVWYEGFPMTIVESFAVGTPVLASELGALTEIVDHRRTGLRFVPGVGAALAAAVQWVADNPDAVCRMRTAARGEYLLRYTADATYTQLVDVYEAAIDGLRATRRRGNLHQSQAR